ncbi:hypothetical protein SARC_14092, partial [Sphaeroforma arctica JP610]
VGLHVVELANAKWFVTTQLDLVMPTFETWKDKDPKNQLVIERCNEMFISYEYVVYVSSIRMGNGTVKYTEELCTRLGSNASKMSDSRLKHDTNNICVELTKGMQS